MNKFDKSRAKAVINHLWLIAKNKRNPVLLDLLSIGILLIGILCFISFFPPILLNISYGLPFMDFVGTMLVALIIVVLGFLLGYNSLSKYEDREYGNGNWKFDKKSFFEFCWDKWFINGKKDWADAVEYMNKILAKEDEMPNKYKSIYLDVDYLKKVFSDEEQKYGQKSLIFYKECEKKNISPVDSINEFNKKANSSNNNPITAKRMFYIGRLYSFYDQRDRANSKYDFKNEIENEIKVVNEKIRHLKELDHSSNELMLGRRAQISNPAFWGGIANGLGGLGPGLLTAYQVEKQNIHNINVSNMHLQLYEGLQSIFIQTEIALEGTVDRLIKSKEKIKKIPINKTLAQDLFEKIGFFVEKYSITEDGFMKINIGTTYNKEDIIVKDNPAIVDGSVKVIILKNGSKIGEAYITNNYSFIDVAKNISKVGFKKNYVALGKADEKNFCKDDEYEFEFKMIHIYCTKKYKAFYFSYKEDDEKLATCYNRFKIFASL